MNLMNDMKTLISKNIRDYGMYIALIVIILIFTILTDGLFISSRNISNLLDSAGYIAVLAVGVMLVIVIRHIDLSIGFLAGFLGAIAAILVPFMSLWRGFFQGYDKMQPTAISQLVEQIVRIIVLLGGSFLVMEVFGGKAQTAVSFAVFAATIGAAGGLIVLYYYWKKYQPEFNSLRSESVTSSRLPLSDIYKEVVKYSVPMVFVGVANPLFKLFLAV